jgi:hypothetical protein
MIGVNVKYKPFQWDDEERTYPAQLITVERVDGEWIAVVFASDMICQVPATKLVEWEVTYVTNY